MPNVIRQDTVINVIPLNRHGVNYNMVKVDCTFQVDTPFAQEEMMFVPSKTEKVSEVIKQLLTQQGFDFAPRLASTIDAPLGNYLQEIKEQKREEARKDSLLGLLMTYMDQIRFAPTKLEGNTHLYTFSYEFPLYPNATNEYELKTTIPFIGLPTVGNFSMQLTLVLPERVQVDTAKTKGVAVNGQEITEQVFTTQGTSNIVSFYWREDPTFTVVYKYL